MVKKKISDTLGKISDLARFDSLDEVYEEHIVIPSYKEVSTDKIKIIQKKCRYVIPAFFHFKYRDKWVEKRID